MNQSVLSLFLAVARSVLLLGLSAMAFFDVGFWAPGRSAISAGLRRVVAVLWLALGVVSALQVMSLKIAIIGLPVVIALLAIFTYSVRESKKAPR